MDYPNLSQMIFTLVMSNRKNRPEIKTYLFGKDNEEQSRHELHSLIREFGTIHIGTHRRAGHSTAIAQSALELSEVGLHVLVVIPNNKMLTIPAYDVIMRPHSKIQIISMRTLINNLNNPPCPIRFPTVSNKKYDVVLIDNSSLVSPDFSLSNFDELLHRDLVLVFVQ